MSAPTPKRQPLPFGKYLLLDRVNIGGMAEVWRAKSFGAGGFEKLVAIKRILPNIAEDEEFITMFIDEAKISAQLTHANIAQIDSLGQISGSYYIAMEYIAGKDVRAIFDKARKKGEPAPIPLSCYVLSKMCEGLDYAHRKKDGMGRDMNIVHRDVSPQNALVSYDGEVKVIDFGIAKAANKATKTQAGILKGKFGYMSPEQIRGLPLDRRSDVFALGVCLYEMLTGERLFVGDSDFSVLEKVRKAEVSPPSQYNRKIPPELERIVLKALAREVDVRYQYANELSDDLQRFLITSDSIFSRKDLMQYMKSTFAEEVDKEFARLKEYAEIKPPEGMLAAAEMGYGGGGHAAAAPPKTPAPSGAPVLSPATPARPRTTNPGMPAVAPPRTTNPGMPAVSPPRTTNPGMPAVAAPRKTSTGMPAVAPMAPPAPPAPPARTPSLTSMPKLTASAPANIAHAGDDEGATMIADDMNAQDISARIAAAEAKKISNKIAAASAPASLTDSTNVGPPPTADRTAPRAPALPPEQPTNVQGARAVGQDEASVTDPGQEENDTTPNPDGEPSEDEVAQAPPPRARRAPQQAGGGKGKLFAILGVAGVLVAGAIGFVVTREPPPGYVLVDVPTDFKGQATVMLNEEKIVPTEWPVIRKMPEGPVMVIVTAEGYQRFDKQVRVASGEYTRLTAGLKRPMAKLVILPDPLTAEVRVDGEVVKSLNDARVALADVASEEEHRVEVRQAGYVTFNQVMKVSGEQQQVAARLSPQEFPLEVISDPVGATILVGDKPFGTAPRGIRVYAGVKELSFTLRCHEPVKVPLTLPAEPGAPIPVRAQLKKIRGCR